MKKICFVFIIFSLFVFVGCGGSNGGNKEENPDAGDTVSDDDSDATPEQPDDTDTEPTNPDNPDTDDPDTEPTEKPDQDKPEPKPDDDADTTPEQPDNTDTEPTPDDDADTGIVEPTEKEKCATVGGTWHEIDETCTKTANCDAFTDEHAEWNGETSYTQTYADGAWSAGIPTEYSETEGKCRFKCVSNYFWNGSACVNPCATDPCGEHSDGCTPADATEYECSCEEGYVPNSTKHGCNPTPATVCTASGGTWHETDETCTCVSGYFWNGTACAELPECSRTSGAPCKDSSTELIWSEKASDAKKWDAAVAYCENLTEGGYYDWHLSNIDELMTLLTADRITDNCQVSEVDCLSQSCWSCSTCTQAGTQVVDGTGCSDWGNSTTDGRYSKFGDSATFFSSSELSSNPTLAWFVGFGTGFVDNSFKQYTNNLRCVRAESDHGRCTAAGGTWNAAEGTCTKTTSCAAFTDEHAQWNSDDSYTRTYADGSWSDVVPTEYSETEGECRFKCASNYFWSGLKCLNPCGTDPCGEHSDGCTSVSVAEYECSCEEGYVPNSAKHGCDPTPATVCTASGGIWNAAEDTCTCAGGYSWNGSLCVVSFTECSPTSGTPCRDSSSGLIWSAKTSDVTWDEAVSYCENLTEGGYDDWHLSNIDEFMTLLIADRVENNCRVNEATGCLSESCWSCSACTQTGTPDETGCSNWGSYYSDGRYSKLGDTGLFFTSSTLSDNTAKAWVLNLHIGYLADNNKINHYAARCVRSQPYADCAAAGGNWNAVEETCTKTTSCAPLTDEHAQWNGINSYTQTYADGSWSAEIPTEYSTEYGTCHFECASTYSWNGSSCIQLSECNQEDITPCKDSSNRLIWSAKSENSMNWSNAKSYCDALNEGGYYDWHLPDIDELTTLLTADIVQSDCQVAASCLATSCWSCQTCTQNNCGTGYNDGRYSKFGASEELWSSSAVSNYTAFAWYIDFSAGGLYYNNKTYTAYVRCVRIAD